MTSSIGSTRSDTRVETRSQTQDVSNAQNSAPPDTGNDSVPDTAPSPAATADATTTARPSATTVAETREAQRKDATRQLQEARLRDAELNSPVTVGTGLGAQAAKGAQAGPVSAANIAPNLDQVAADTHVLMEGHRDMTPDGGVQTTQEMLNRGGANLAEDGIFGPNTRGAVEAFQRENGLTVDGKVGDQTLAALEARDAEVMREEITQSSLPPETQQAVLSRMDAAATAADQRGIHGLATSDNFRGLDATQQAEFLDAAAVDPDNAAYTGQLEALAGDAEFGALDPAIRERTLEQIGKHADDPDAAATLATLAGSEGFGALPQAEQSRMLDYVGADTDFIAPEARRSLDAIMADSAFQGMNAADQAATLQGFMRDQPGLPGVLGFPQGHMDGQRREYSISDPQTITGHTFRGSTEDALRYDVTVGEHTVPVYLPANQNAANGNFHTLDQIAKGLAAMPDVALQDVTDITVNPVANPDDAFWAQQYNDPNFSSYMTAGAGGNITVYPTQHPQTQDFLDGSLLHEVGHTVSHNLWGHDETQPAWQDYRDAIAADGIDVSTYGQNNADEDFSESFQLYMGVRGTPQEAEVRAMYPHRFAILDRIVNGRE